MIELYYWPTPNGHKITQFPEISPNNRMPAIDDTAPADGGAPFEYSIADMACHPWIDPYDKAPLDLEPFAELRRWHASIAARPATQRAYALARQVNPDAGKPLDEAQRKLLFGQGARK